LLVLGEIAPFLVPRADRDRAIGLGEAIDMDGPKVELAEAPKQRGRPRGSAKGHRDLAVEAVGGMNTRLFREHPIETDRQGTRANTGLDSEAPQVKSSGLHIRRASLYGRIVLIERRCSKIYWCPWLLRDPVRRA
jgi:hypothetical protein